MQKCTSTMFIKLFCNMTSLSLKKLYFNNYSSQSFFYCEKKKVHFIVIYIDKHNSKLFVTFNYNKFLLILRKDKERIIIYNII